MDETTASTSEPVTEAPKHAVEPSEAAEVAAQPVTESAAKAAAKPAAKAAADATEEPADTTPESTAQDASAPATSPAPAPDTVSSANGYVSSFAASAPVPAAENLLVKRLLAALGGGAIAFLVLRKGLRRNR